MRSFHLLLSSTLILAPTLAACGGDDGTGSSGETGESGTGETGTSGETGTASGDGDGDPATGDGDGDPTTGDGDGDPSGDGDGDPMTGDGDGDPMTGDGDGDMSGDGDGDKGCEPVNDTPCALCAAENCCDELMACEADEDCACITACFAEGQINPQGCFGECGVDNPMSVEPLGALRMCQMDQCGDACQMGGG